MKTFDHWLGLLGGTVVMRAASVTACDLSWVGDGYCDRQNNNENCGGYDGGDCCECTCIDEAYECGIVSFSCIDPAAACVDDDDYVPWYYMYDYYYYYTDDDASNPSASCLPTLAGDGLCDSTQNNAECGYDGGDCCDCTCVDAVYECGYGGFDCTDPAAACEDEDDDFSEPRGGDGSCGVAGFGSVGDGQCNSENNNEGCGYDGGDCCECTCVDAAYDCGTASFSCIDPEAWCVDEEDNGSEDCDDAASCADVASKSLSDTNSSSRKAARWALIALATFVNVVAMCCIRKCHRTNNDLVHSKLLLTALVISLAEGVSLFYLVPESKESLKILVVFLFGFVSALSEFFLRRATSSHVGYAISNFILEAAFAVVLLFFFVEQTTDNVFLFGGLAGNEILVGFAITCSVDDDPSTEDSVRAGIELGIEIFFILVEAAVDGGFPLIYRELLKPSFHPESWWRSDIVFTAWSFFGMANIAIAATYNVSPVNKLALGTKLKTAVQGCLLNGGFGLMSFIILGVTEANIENPPTWDVVWSCLMGTTSVLVALGSFVQWCSKLRGVADGETATEESLADKAVRRIREVDG